ncbi:YveK family protein [Paenibacillus chitinolyticus]|uniref:YveK family protein n=1 Tax=Paenibacillus chitinolyticus TaxID=79263 RepID=UPI00386319D6
MDLDLKGIFLILKKRLWLILTVILLTCIATGIASFYFIKPEYAANTKLVVNSSYQFEGSSRIDYGEVSASIMLVNTYKEIIKTPAIMDKVASKLPELKLTADEIIQKVKVSTINETQVLTITVTDENYEAAVKLVNTISGIFKTDIPTIMKVDNVTILNEAKLDGPAVPVKPSPKMNLVLAFVLSGIVAMGLAFLLEYLDDTIKTEKEIDKYLGLPTLASIGRIKSSDLKSKVPLNPSQKAVGENIYVSANQ